MAGSLQFFRLANRLRLRNLSTGLALGLVFLMFTAGSVLTQDFEYKLGTGDEIRITVFGHEDLSGEFAVGSDGAISLPLIGEIGAADRTLREIELAIKGELKPDYLKNPQVSVEVINYRPFYIIGEVKNPGGYPYVGGMRVVNAVALAGGFTYRAREDEFFVSRATRDGKRETAVQSTLIFPGDVVEVRERFF